MRNAMGHCLQHGSSCRSASTYVMFIQSDTFGGNHGDIWMHTRTCGTVYGNNLWDTKIHWCNHRKGLTGKQAEFAVKKYKSHRRVGPHVMQDLQLLLS